MIFKRKISWIFIAAMISFAGIALNANAVPQGIGVGVTAPEPIGVTGKFWMGNNAIDITAGYSPQNFYMLSADYLLHYDGMAGMKTLFPYIGAGPVLFGSSDDARRDGSWYADDRADDLGLGVHVPVGVEWQGEDFPLAVSVQVAPGLGFVPKSFTFLSAGVAARYYF